MLVTRIFFFFRDIFKNYMYDTPGQDYVERVQDYSNIKSQREVVFSNPLPFTTQSWLLTTSKKDFWKYRGKGRNATN